MAVPSAGVSTVDAVAAALSQPKVPDGHYITVAWYPSPRSGWPGFVRVQWPDGLPAEAVLGVLQNAAQQVAGVATAQAGKSVLHLPAGALSSIPEGEPVA